MSESFDFAAETFACSLGEWIVPRKPTLRNGFCRAEENIDLVSKLRRLLPGKETRSAEENLEDRRRTLPGLNPGAAESQ